MLELVVGKDSFLTEVAQLAEERRAAASSQQELPGNKATQRGAESRAGQRDRTASFEQHLAVLEGTPQHSRLLSAECVVVLCVAAPHPSTKIRAGSEQVLNPHLWDR